MTPSGIMISCLPSGASDPRSWDVSGLCKWAMSAFRVSLSPSKVKTHTPEEIEEQLISAAAEQVDKKDASDIAGFLRDDFALMTFIEWARAKFDIALDVDAIRRKKEEEGE